MHGDLHVVALLRMWFARERKGVGHLGVQVVTATGRIAADKGRQVAGLDFQATVRGRRLVLEEHGRVEIALVVVVELDHKGAALVRIVVRRATLDVGAFDLDRAVVPWRISRRNRGDNGLAGRRG
ncbi:hypothetical protein F1D05_25700 [Kribbella qitaiheensis]|uniref:Uncharacterized protein n=1 Tax=Kribbella qitaiheensis TaxID=1544730 RepID=A0A7G6X372_9ACTN|nr:hypothetical protein F1D05_25700 [Kribbella qitaiheensis]